MWQIRAEREEDAGAVETLVNQGFGPGRFAKTAYRLREGVAADTRLSFVAESQETGELLGAVRFWPIMVGDSLQLLLGPLAVEPALRGQGIGIALMQRGIEEARALDYDAVILVGDEPYYRQFGFVPDLTRRMLLPGPVDRRRFLGLELRAGALAGASGQVQPA